MWGISAEKIPGIVCMNEKRMRSLKKEGLRKGPVVYWMSRDQRARDNWALLYAQRLALTMNMPLAVVFCLVPDFLNATLRQYGFMLKGLQETERGLSGKNIPFFVLAGRPEKELPSFIRKHVIGAVVTDFDPLRIKRNWKQGIEAEIEVPFLEVDTHNIVPCWMASERQEYGARTLRPKINRILHEFLDEFPALLRHPFPWVEKAIRNDWDALARTLTVDRTVREVEWIRPGEREARQALRDFLKKGLTQYRDMRNDPTRDGQSDLSPYLHFGHLSAQRVALEALKAEAPRPSKDAFLEEVIVRRELSDNFCFYNMKYDSFEGFPEWARKTLNEHRKDRRTYLYTPEQFGLSETHDQLWNAAQTEMVKRGKMHGYMRMYWAKKILEWTRSPEEALEIAIYLNDRHELDGRDPNGFTGIAWSIGGVHDRAWNERKVFGKVRYMSYNGCKSRFNTKAYIDYVNSL